MQIQEITVGIVATRCYILSGDRDSKACIVIDPGAEAARIRKAAGERKIAAILLTHGHFDHIGAVRELYENSELSPRQGDPSTSLRSVQDDNEEKPRIVIHALDAPMLTDPELNAGKGLLGRSITAPEATDPVKEGDELELAGLKVKVLHTPGHTPGSVCYLIEGELFTGDTMFEYGWGRTDLPGGNEAQMRQSLQRLAPMVRTMPMHAGH